MSTPADTYRRRATHAGPSLIDKPLWRKWQNDLEKSCLLTECASRIVERGIFHICNRSDSKSKNCAGHSGTHRYCQLQAAWFSRSSQGAQRKCRSSRPEARRASRGTSWAQWCESRASDWSPPRRSCSAATTRQTSCSDRHLPVNFIRTFFHTLIIPI